MRARKVGGEVVIFYLKCTLVLGVRKVPSAWFSFLFQDERKKEQRSRLEVTVNWKVYCM